MVGLGTIHHKAGVSLMVCPPMGAHMPPPLTTCWIHPIEFVDKLGGFMTSFVLLWCRSLVLFSGCLLVVFSLHPGYQARKWSCIAGRISFLVLLWRRHLGAADIYSWAFRPFRYLYKYIHKHTCMSIQIFMYIVCIEIKLSLIYIYIVYIVLNKYIHIYILNIINYTYIYIYWICIYIYCIYIKCIYSI